MSKKFNSGLDKSKFIKQVQIELKEYKQPKIETEGNPTNEKKWIKYIRKIKRKDLLKLEKELNN